jgi:hypothetical protein
MTQAEIDWPMSLALSAKDRADTKEQSSFDSALSSALVSALGVALQRCSYPPHECRESTMLFHPPFTMGTSLLCRIGGHFYFALTGITTYSSGDERFFRTCCNQNSGGHLRQGIRHG